MKNYLLIMLLVILSFYTVHFVRYEGSTVIIDNIRDILNLDLVEMIKFYFLFLYVIFSIVILISFKDSNRLQRIIVFYLGALTILITTIQYRLDWHSLRIYFERVQYNQYYRLDRWFYVFNILMFVYAFFASGKNKYIYPIIALLVNALIFTNFLIWFINELESLTV